jgi:hypothetical protein
MPALGENPSRRPVWIFALAGVTLVLSVVNLVMVPLVGVGFSARTATPTAFVDRIESIPSQFTGAATRPDLWVGDQLDLRRMTPGDRFRWREQPVPGEPLLLYVERGGRAISVAFSTIRYHYHLDNWLGLLGNVWTAGFASFIAFRLASRADARILIAVLCFGILGNALSPGNWATYSQPTDAIMAALGALSAAGYWAFSRYAARFALPLTRQRRILTNIAGTAALAAGLFNAAGVVAIWFGWFDPNRYLLAGSALNVTMMLAPVVCVFATLMATRGEERSRIVWTATPICLAFILNAFSLVTSTMNITPLSGYGSGLATLLGNIGAFLEPLGLTYVLFNRGILDIGFALNRAAVFGATSLIIAGVFGVLQWLANTFVTKWTHQSSILSQILIVIVIFYTVRLSRERTEVVVTRVFFASRDRRLHAIHALTRALDDVEHESELGPFIVDYLATRADITVRVYFEDEAGEYVSATATPAGERLLSRSETPLIELRSSRAPLRAPEWSHLGSIAIPMLVRGRLRGVMFCKLRDGGEFAPDELEALTFVALCAANNREDLLASELRREVLTLRSRVSDSIA